MQVTRETVNKEPYLITDYIYQNDNVGINLNLLNNAKTKKVLRVAGIPIDYSPISLNRSGNEIIATSNLIYVDNKIKATMDIFKTPDPLGVDKETATEDACRIEHVISDESFEAIKNRAGKSAEC